jgi:hypothetical protein
MQLLAVNALLGSSDLCDGPIDLARLCASRAELNDGIPDQRLIVGGKSTNIDVVSPPIDAVDHEVPALA